MKFRLKYFLAWITIWKSPWLSLYNVFLGVKLPHMSWTPLYKYSISYRYNGVALFTRCNFNNYRVISMWSALKTDRILRSSDSDSDSARVMDFGRRRGWWPGRGLSSANPTYFPNRNGAEINFVRLSYQYPNSSGPLSPWLSHSHFFN